MKSKTRNVVIPLLLIIALSLQMVVFPINFSNSPKLAHYNITENKNSVSLNKFDGDKLIINSHNDTDIVSVIIRFKDSIPMASALSTIFSSVDYNSAVTFKYIYENINAISVTIPFNLVKQLSLLPFVEYIYEDRNVSIPKVKGFPDVFGPWPNATETIHADKLWDLGLLGDNITVGIIDTGVDSNHPDLDDQDDNETTLDPKIIAFKDLVNNRDDLDPTDGMSAYDDNGHGTAVAGIISGTGVLSNGSIRGVAPNSRLVVVKALDAKGDGSVSDLVKAVDFCILRHVDVISMSLGAPQTKRDPLEDITRKAVSEGIVVVVAAGNEGPVQNTISSPGSTPEVITVAATFGNLYIPPWSSVGPTLINNTLKPDVAAPGMNVLTTRGNASTIYDAYKKIIYKGTYPYRYFSGTSAATPFVSGVVALLLEKYQNATPVDVKLALMKTAKTLNAQNNCQGAGLIDAYAAYNLLAQNQTMTLLYPTNFELKSMLLYANSSIINLMIITNANITTTDISISFSGNLSTIVSYSSFKNYSKGYFISFVEPKVNLISTSRVGTYIGDFLIKVNDTLYTSHLELTLLPYRGRVLYDLYHQDKIYDNDVPSATLIDAFTRNQFSFETWSEEITPGILQFTDVLIINDIENALTDAEISAIKNWVKDGGFLILMTGSYNQTTNSPTYAAESYNELLQPYGVKPTDVLIGSYIAENSSFVGNFYGNGYGGSVESSPLTKNVSYVYVAFGVALSVDKTKGAEGLIWINNSYALMALTKAGNGKILAIGDDSLWADSLVAEAVLHNADNAKLAYDIGDYVKPNKPVVYDLIVSTNENGAFLRLLAFSSENKPITVHLGIKHVLSGWDNSTLSATNGYLFTATLPDSVLTYDVFITITDSEGSSRVIHIVIEGLLNLPLLIIIVAMFGVLIVAVFIVVRQRKRRESIHPYYTPEGYVIYPEGY